MHYRTVYNRLLPWTLYTITVFSVWFEQWQKTCWIVLKSDPASSLELDSLVQPPREINSVLTPVTLFFLRFLKGLLQSSASFRRKLKISFHKIFIVTVFLQNLPFTIKALPRLLRMKYLHCKGTVIWCWELAERAGYTSWSATTQQMRLLTVNL